MSEFDLQALVEALHERGVEFVVIGGVAVGAHGYLRSTEDLDVVPAPDPDNLERLTGALRDLESTQLAEDAVQSQLFGIPVRICSLSRLREMKEAQGRAQDKADLENLPKE